MKKIIVLISGNGSNLQAIIDACANGQLNLEIALVISNKTDAFGLQRAQQANIKTLVKTKLNDQSREAYDQELAEVIKEQQPDFIVLAGWMRLLSNHFLKHFPQQVINLHPALPHTFPGINAIERAFTAFQNNEIQHTGAMTHFVPDEGVDDGPIIFEQIVPIYAEDSLATLSERMHHTEHALLIKTLLYLICHTD
jgi:phosphoribosylglycinamide formyltransferase-1